MYLSDVRLATLLERFLNSPSSMQLVRQLGLRSAHPLDYAGEIYEALRRQCRTDIKNPNAWIYVNARWHLKNAIRREMRTSLKQSIGEDLAFAKTHGRRNRWN